MRWKVLMLCFAISVAAHAEHGKNKTHPLFGKWEWTLPNGCTETYEFHPDHTCHITSGAETGQSKFTIADEPDANGFYRMTDEQVQSNGALGCAGTATPVGDVVSFFVLFRSHGTRVLFCGTQDLRSCMGPLRKVTGS